MEDALAVLDAFDLEKAWAIGHSWGGHLALHLVVAHPGRFHGIVCVETLGASPDPIAELRENLRRNLVRRGAHAGPGDRRGEGAGEATEEGILERQAILWPHYFFDSARAPPSRGHGRTGVPPRDEHVDRGALRARHPGQRPAEGPDARALCPWHRDPLPVSASVDTAKLIRKARVARIPRAGHYPWIEQPGFLNRMLRGLLAQL